MNVWRNELEGDVVVGHELFQFTRSLVVESLESGFKATFGELGVNGSVCSQEFVFCARGERFGDDGIGIVGVHNQNVLVAATGGEGETSCLVAVNFAGFNWTYVEII
jgi:hypothetical protein